MTEAYQDQLPRYDPKGATFDQAMNLTFSKFQMFMQTWFPTFFNWMIDQLIVSMSKKAFPKVPASWKLSPAPSMATTAPLIADDLWPLMESGFCEPVAKVSEVTGPKSVELSDGRILEDIDAIIYCTGYDMETPFVEKEHNPYPVRSAPAELYRGTFPLHEDPEVRNSLAFLGHSAVPFPGFVQHELIGMAVSQIWQGKTLLPSLGEMKKWHQGFLKWRNDLLRKQKSPATFYVAFMPFTDHITWFDQAAGTDVWSHFGMFSWNAWSFWWSDRAFYRKCASGLFSPAIWRLFETGKRKTWPQAKEQVYIDNEIAEKQIKDRAEKLKAAEDKKTQ